MEVRVKQDLEYLVLWVGEGSEVVLMLDDLTFSSQNTDPTPTPSHSTVWSPLFSGRDHIAQTQSACCRTGDVLLDTLSQSVNSCVSVRGKSKVPSSQDSPGFVRGSPYSTWQQPQSRLLELYTWVQNPCIVWGVADRERGSMSRCKPLRLFLLS